MITFDVIGKRVQSERERAGMSQQQLADALNQMGMNISRETISKIENGSRTISVVEAKAICEILFVNIEELLKDEQEDDSLVTLFRKIGEFQDDELGEILEIQEGLKDFILQKGLYNGSIVIKKRIPAWRED